MHPVQLAFNNCRTHPERRERAYWSWWFINIFERREERGERREGNNEGICTRESVIL